MAVYVVCKSKPYYGNVLGYDTGTGEYVYYHKKKEIWREKGTRELFDYCAENHDNLDIHKCEEFPVYVRYSKSCQEQKY